MRAPPRAMLEERAGSPTWQCLVWLLPLAALACGDDGASATPDAAADAALSAACQEATMHSDLQWIQENIFTPTCAISGCHRGPTAAQGVDLSAGEAEGSLVDRESGRFGGETLVIPGDSRNSYLMVALGTFQGQLSNAGTMPPGFAILCREKREAIERWITSLGN